MLERDSYFNNPIVGIWRFPIPPLARWHAPPGNNVQIVRGADVHRAWRSRLTANGHPQSAAPSIALNELVAVHIGRHYLPINISLHYGDGESLPVTVWITWQVYDATWAAAHPQLRVSTDAKAWLQQFIDQQLTQRDMYDPSEIQRWLMTAISGQTWQLEAGIMVAIERVLIEDDQSLSLPLAERVGPGVDHDDLDEQHHRDFRTLRHRLQHMDEEVTKALQLADKYQQLARKGQQFAELGPLAFLGLQAITQGLTNDLIDALRDELERTEERRQQQSPAPFPRSLSPLGEATTEPADASGAPDIDDQMVRPYLEQAAAQEIQNILDITDGHKATDEDFVAASASRDLSAKDDSSSYSSQDSPRGHTLSAHDTKEAGIARLTDGDEDDSAPREPAADDISSEEWQDRQ